MARGLAGKASVVAWAENTGRNDWDDPNDVPESMSVESLNVTLDRGALGVKRAGTALVPLAGAAFTGGVGHLARFLPGQDLGAVELFVIAIDGLVIRVATTNVGINLGKPPGVAQGIGTNTAQLDGKLYFAFPFSSNRIWLYDPATGALRPSGIKGSTDPPVVTDHVGGVAPATIRYYRIAYRVKSGPSILRQSELGPSVAFTPSGTAGAYAARLQRVFVSDPGEGETHWVVYGSPDDRVYYELAELPKATNIYDDLEAPSDYDEHPAAPIDGSFFPFPGVKYIASDGVRLFGLGVNGTPPTPNPTITIKPGTAYWTPPMGSSEIGATVGVGDSERIQSTVNQDDFLPLSITAGGVDRGISGPFFNAMYFFMDRGIYKLVPTDDARAPFRRVTVSRWYGSLSHHSQVLAEDENGNEALYFLDPADGPRRIVAGDGVQWIGKDVNALWRTVNRSALMPAHGVYDRERKQIKWWVAVGSEDTPTTNIIVHHVMLGRTVAHDESVRGGFARWNGPLAVANTSLMFPIALTSPRPIFECVYTGASDEATRLRRQDGTLRTDFGTPYQGYVLSKAWTWGIYVRRKRIIDAFVLAAAAAPGTRITQTVVKDFGVEAIPMEVAIDAPVGTGATYVRANVQGTDIADAICDQIQLGDTRPIDTAWRLCRWDALVEAEDTR